MGISSVSDYTNSCMMDPGSTTAAARESTSPLHEAAPPSEISGEVGEAGPQSEKEAGEIAAAGPARNRGAKRPAEEDLGSEEQKKPRRSGREPQERRLLGHEQADQAAVNSSGKTGKGPARKPGAAKSDGKKSQAKMASDAAPPAKRTRDHRARKAVSHSSDPDDEKARVVALVGRIRFRITTTHEDRALAAVLVPMQGFRLLGNDGLFAFLEKEMELSNSATCMVTAISATLIWDGWSMRIRRNMLSNDWDLLRRAVEERLSGCQGEHPPEIGMLLHVRVAEVGDGVDTS